MGWDGGGKSRLGGEGGGWDGVRTKQRRGVGIKGRAQEVEMGGMRQGTVERH